MCGCFITLKKRYFFGHCSFPPVNLFGYDFDSEVGTTQFALHAFDTGFKIFDRGIKAFHFKYVFRAEFHTNMAPFAVLLDNLNFW
jgi:hypothetical protein